MILALALCSVKASLAQEPMSEAEAFGQLYHQYDPSTRTAQWVCPASKEQAEGHEGWPCGKEYASVAVSDLLMAQVREGDSLRTYVLTSAAPAHAPMGYDCHACAPAIGAAVFEWKQGHWTVQSMNSVIGFYGGWGEPPGFDFVAVGDQKHGFLLSLSNEAQGYSNASSVLLLPLGPTVSNVWEIENEDDNFGACDPSDKENSCVPYRASAAYQFISGDQNSAYYDIEVISRGKDREDFAHPLVSENWTDVYRFSGGKYRLIRHTPFTEAKKPAKSTTAGTKR